MKGKRKKLTALFRCVVFIAALTACAGKNEEAAYSEEPAVQSEVETSYSETSETDDRQATSLSGENKVDENTEETCRQTGYRYSSSPVSSWFRRAGMNKLGQG